MWTSTVDLDPKRVLLTQVLGRIWHGAYFASFAPLRVQNVPREPLPARNWVRVRNRLAGISGNDLHLVYADGDFRVAPATLPTHGLIYPGDEVMGEVIEIGDDVQEVRVGDRVALQAGPNCLSSGVQPLCRACAHGSYDLCEYGQQAGPHPIGGGWSEEMLLHEQQLFRVSPTLSDEQTVLLKPTSVALHAVLRCPPQPGDRVLIIGAGTIGLLTLQVLRSLAPQIEISVLARHAFQVEQATRMGATHIIYPQDAYRGVQRATHARLFNGLIGNQMLLGGYDVVFDSVGSRKTLHHALRWTRASGTIVLSGHSSHLMQIDLTPIWHQEINLIGSSGQGNEQWPLGTQDHRPTMNIAAELIEQGQLHPEQLITHRFALNDYRSALTSFANKAQSRAVKVLFDFSLLPPSVVPNMRASLRRPASAEQLPAAALPDAIPTTPRSRHIPPPDQVVQPPAFLSNYADEIPVTPAIQKKPDAPLLLPEYDRTSSTAARRRPAFFIEEESEDMPEDTSPSLRAVGRTERATAAPPHTPDVEQPTSPIHPVEAVASIPTEDATETTADEEQPTSPIHPIEFATSIPTEDATETAPDVQEPPPSTIEHTLEPEPTQASEEPSQKVEEQTAMASVEIEEPLPIVTEQPSEDLPANEDIAPIGAEQVAFSEPDGQIPDEVEPVPVAVEAEAQVPDKGEQAPPVAEAQTLEEVEQVPFPAVAEAQTPDEVEQVPAVVETQVPDEVEPVPFPADLEKLPDDVSEPAPWTWLSYLENEQIAPPPAPAVTQAAEEPEQSATEGVPVALQSVEDLPSVEKGRRAPARKRSRKVIQQDNNT